MITRSIAISALIVAVSLPLHAQEQEYDCTACKDTGKIVCHICKARQGLWCSECASRYACPFCSGIGWILCTSCGGEDAKAELTFLLEQRDKRDKIGQAVGTNLRCIETAWFRLFTDIDHRKAHQYALILETYAEKYNATFGNEPKDKLWKDKCDVYLFQPRKAFVKFAVTVDGRPEAAGSGGYSYPSPAGPLIVLFNESRTDDDTLRTIIHELAHVFLAVYHGDSTLPVWVHEGIAQRFEFTHKPETSRRKEAARRIREALNAGKLMPLRELAEVKFGPADNLPYAAAWSAIDFLMTTDKPAFVKWVKLMKEGQDQHKAFEAAFARPLGAASRAWRAQLGKQK
ncbi:MAG: DUF1570 domain-containing protein [Planctomycetes bacterium]|nr:DUF1570 domain-containing protein [Planctomycetota bacterium]